MPTNEEHDFSLFQLVADQLVSIIGAELGNGSGPKSLGRRLLISDRETNDIHIDPCTIYLNPYYFVSENQQAVILRVFALSEEFDSEREKQTRRAVNSLSWNLRITMKKLFDIAPGVLESIIREEYLGEKSEEPLALEEVNNA
jgi:23S rRNA maturation mini-RNase III